MAGSDYYGALNKSLLQAFLKNVAEVTVIDTCPSTNVLAKEAPLGMLPNVFIADEQTLGRGRLGRSFYSPKAKGIYMSMVFKPDCYFEKGQLATSLAAVAVSRAIEKVAGLKAKIKWVNDIVINDKKVAGILTEAETNFETGRISKIVIGFGINCFKSDFPSDFAESATCLETLNPNITQASDFATFRERLASEVIKEFCTMFDAPDKSIYMEEYRSKSTLIGQPVMVYNSAISESMGRTGRTVQGVRAKAIGIDDNGGLIVEFMEGRYTNQTTTIRSGEVTIRKRI